MTASTASIEGIQEDEHNVALIVSDENPGHVPLDGDIASDSYQADNTLSKEGHALLGTVEQVDNKKHASVISSYINLTNTILGAGVLGLPYAIGITGIVFGLVLLVSAGGAAIFGLHLLAVCSREVRGKSSYFAVAKMTFPWGAILIDTAVAIKCIGVGIAYLIVIGDLMPAAVEEFGVDEGFLVDRLFWITVLLGVFIVPLSLLPKMDFLKYTSILALVSVAYVIAMVTGYFADREAIEKPRISTWRYWDFSVDTFSAIPIFTFAFTCHQNLFTIYNELGRKRANGPQMWIVILTSTYTCFMVYLCAGVMGYFTFGETVDSNFLKSYPVTIPVTIARIAVVVLVTFSYPLQAHPARACIENLIFGNFFPKFGWRRTRHVIITTFIVVFTWLIAWRVPNIDLVFSLVGSTGSTIICYILPGGFYYKLKEKHPWTIKKAGALLLAIVGIILMFVNVTMTLAKTFYFDKQK